MNVDLHCHSTASDGQLTPRALYERALESSVDLLALTDHDTVAGLVELNGWLATEPPQTCRVIAGVELSSVWNKRGVHVVGLDFDLQAPVMQEALAGQHRIRIERAQRIGEKLAQQGIEGAYLGACDLADSDAPCRPHFADWLVQQDVCSDGKQAFTRYLGNSKLPAINHQWPELAQVVGWIVDAGGVAVLAHPEDYRLTRSKLRALVRAFVGAGGQAMELAGKGKADAIATSIEKLCLEYNLHASVGSDFHGGAQPWRQLGKTRAMPGQLSPVWKLFQ